MFARFDENPAMTLRVIKETKRYGRTDGRTDNVKTVYPLQTKFAGGININNQPVMPDIKVSENGILKLLKDLNPHKAAGPDELKPLVLRELREVIAPMLVVIFQRSIETGRVPKDWNDANVCPLFKKGDKSIASNYRPISLTCILCKVLEHIFASNLVTHLDSHRLLYDLQHGFRSKRSCETQLVMLMEDLSKNAIKGPHSVRFQ